MFLEQVKNMGYGEINRSNLLKDFKKRHNKILDQISKWERIPYRNSFEIETAKKWKKGTFTNTWLLRGTDTRA